MRKLMKLLLILPLLTISLAAVGCDTDDEVEMEREPGGAVEVEND
jgi:hypothetical protein